MSAAGPAASDAGVMSPEEFGRQFGEVVRAGGPDAQARVAEIAVEAQKNPHILDGFADQSARLEYHLFRSDDGAIKIFNFNESLTVESPVHDHAGFWAVYVVFSGEMKMAFYEEEVPDRRPWPGLRRGEELTMKPGDCRQISPEELHSVWSTVPGTVVFTLYNGDLNAAPRRIYDQNAKLLIKDRSQWQARQDQGAYSSSSGGQLRALDESELCEES